MGLAICRQIVEAHEGRIAASSEVGVGTRMTITLPRPSEPDAEDGEAS